MSSVHKRFRVGKPFPGSVLSRVLTDVKTDENAHRIGGRFFVSLVFSFSAAAYLAFGNHRTHVVPPQTPSSTVSVSTVWSVLVSGQNPSRTSDHTHNRKHASTSTFQQSPCFNGRELFPCGYYTQKLEKARKIIAVR